jgi:hypothetical protein
MRRKIELVPAFVFIVADVKSIFGGLCSQNKSFFHLLSWMDHKPQPLCLSMGRTASFFLSYAEDFWGSWQQIWGDITLV